jgi:hypothetical protein
MTFRHVTEATMGKETKSHAERQRRYRERQKEIIEAGKASRDAPTLAPSRDGPTLTAQQKADLLTVEQAGEIDNESSKNRFLGWNRFQWCHANDELIAVASMTAIVQRWRREWDEALVEDEEEPEWDRGALHARWWKEHGAAQQAEREAQKQARAARAKSRRQERADPKRTVT